MSTALTPYRQAGQIEVHEKTQVKRTGLIPAPPPVPPHKCEFPKKYTKTSKERRFLFFSKIITTEHDVLQGSLYRCPDCYKVYLYDKEEKRYGGYGMLEWMMGEKANELWFKETGEYIDGEH